MIIFVNSIKQFVSIIVKYGVAFAVRTEFFSNIKHYLHDMLK